MNDDERSDHESALLRRTAQAIGPVPQRVVEKAKAQFPAAEEEPDSEGPAPDQVDHADD